MAMSTRAFETAILDLLRMNVEIGFRVFSSLGSWNVTKVV